MKAKAEILSHVFRLQQSLLAGDDANDESVD